jgi:hypothetical protein
MRKEFVVTLLNSNTWHLYRSMCGLSLYEQNPTHHYSSSHRHAPHGETESCASLNTPYMRKEFVVTLLNSNTWHLYRSMGGSSLYEQNPTCHYSSSHRHAPHGETESCALLNTPYMRKEFAMTLLNNNGACSVAVVSCGMSQPKRR